MARIMYNAQEEPFEKADADALAFDKSELLPQMENAYTWKEELTRVWNVGLPQNTDREASGIGEEDVLSVYFTEQNDETIPGLWYLTMTAREWIWMLIRGSKQASIEWQHKTAQLTAEQVKYIDEAVQTLVRNMVDVATLPSTHASINEPEIYRNYEAK